MANFSSKALEADESGQLKEAIGYYEEAIKSGELSPKLFTNLIVIYWDLSFDYGANSNLLTEGIFTSDEVTGFDEKYKSLLGRSVKLFPDSVEIRFWDRYINEMITYSEHGSSDLFREFMRENPSFLTPLFYINSFSSGLTKEEMTKFNELKQDLIQSPTYMNRYVLSYM